MKKVIPFLTVLWLSIGVYAQRQAQMDMAVSRPVQFNLEMNFLCYLPEDFTRESGQLYPLVIFLHGSGERGTDLNLVKRNGPPKLAENQSFPAIMVSPQCPEGVWWDVFVLNKFLDQLISMYPVDTTRIYLTGLSMGGYGTWEWATRYPERFAAIVPVCGSGNPHRAERLVKIPIWAFHGAMDDVVPIEKSIEMVQAVNRKGGHAKLTVYPEAGHDSWTDAYNDPEMWKWMMSKKL